MTIEWGSDPKYVLLPKTDWFPRSSGALEPKRIRYYYSKEGSRCFFLQLEACLYINKYGIVRIKIQQLQSAVQKCREQYETTNSWVFENLICEWILPFLKPHVIFLALLPASLTLSPHSSNDKFKRFLAIQLINFLYKIISHCPQRNMLQITIQWTLRVRVSYTPKQMMPLDCRKQLRYLIPLYMPHYCPLISLSLW